jgi:diguanylate cyclase (GGDEF)-like protein
MVCAVMALCYTFFPILIERSPHKGIVYVIAAAVSMSLSITARLKIKAYKQGKHISPTRVYVLIILGYTNVILFGTYIGVWSSPEVFAVNFMVFLVCALFIFSNPPTLNLVLTLCAVLLFILSTITTKPYIIWRFDIVNVSLAGVLSLIFSWYISRYRLLATFNEIELEKERNKYYDESLEDELTHLKNRRDFTYTFGRYLNNYRESDKYLCLALLDIDFFKNYNDHYGHPRGDECLRVVGRVLNELKTEKGIYTARVGGEEFALLWFDNDRGKIESIVSKVQEKIKKVNIPHAKSSVSERLTVSIGVYIALCGAFEETRTIYDLADAALYKAKDKGRNCTVISQEDVLREPE